MYYFPSNTEKCLKYFQTMFFSSCYRHFLLPKVYPISDQTMRNAFLANLAKIS